MAYFLLQAENEKAESLANAILGIKNNLVLCATCFNITDVTPCIICRDEDRDRSKICVVEEPADIIPLERTKKYVGLYHVLHGVISPAEGIGPDQLKINELLSRLQDGVVTELILATNPNTEGESTNMYIHNLVSPLNIHVTRLARGLPFGGDLEYADDLTLS